MKCPWSECLNVCSTVGAAKLDEVVIAIPDASEGRIHEISQLLARTGLKSYAISSPTGF